jgi:hypothetical protein
VPQLPCSAASATNCPKQTRHYQVFFEVAQKVHSSGVFGEESYLGYDLVVHPESVCFSLVGRNVLGLSLSSNTVVIPESLIAAAVAGQKSH